MSPRSNTREFVLSAAAVAFMVGYTGLTLSENPALRAWAWALSAVVWVIFAGDIITRAIRIGPARYFRRHWWELLVLVVPAFRALRSITMVRQIPYFRHVTQQSIRYRLLLEMLLGVTLYVYVSSLTAFRFEHLAQGATIDSWGNATWWTIVTMATVGYGDFTPVTIMGRVVAVCNMVVGIIVIGITSATVVNYLSQLTSKAARDPREG